MTLPKRIAKLEGKRCAAALGPCVIFFCDPATGETSAAMLVGGGNLTREENESAATFTTRATAAATSIRLSDATR